MLTFKCRKTGRLTFACVQKKWAGAVCVESARSLLCSPRVSLLDH